MKTKNKKSKGYSTWHEACYQNLEQPDVWLHPPKAKAKAKGKGKAKPKSIAAAQSSVSGLGMSYADLE